MLRVAGLAPVTVVAAVELTSRQPYSPEKAV
jgi:hypothetical protein